MKITEKERDYLDDCIYLPMVLTLFENDLKIIAAAPFKMKQPYLQMLNRTIKWVHQDLHRINQYLRWNHLSVEKIAHDAHFTTYQLNIHGYQEECRYFNAHIRNQVQKRVEKYLNEYRDDKNLLL